MWAAHIATHLNQRVLPKRCFSEAQVHVGGRVEVDVGTFDDDDLPMPMGNGAGGVAIERWAPPVAAVTVPAVFPDEIEVQVFHHGGGQDLVGAIELVSPGNKDRSEAIDAFTAKCATYLQQGVGLLVVDIVSARLANMHVELMRRLGHVGTADQLGDTVLYAVSYWPHRTPAGDVIDIWPNTLAIGRALPIMPLALRRLPIIPVDLETTYKAACEASRL